MSEPRPDPKVVLQAHALRSAATRQALLHGDARPRTHRAMIGALWGTVVLAVVIVILVIVASRIITVVHHNH